MLDRLTGWWRGLSRGDRVALALGETSIVLLALWVFSWSFDEDGVALAGIIFAAFQVPFLMTVGFIAGARRSGAGAGVKAPTVPASDMSALDLVGGVLFTIAVVFFKGGGFAYIAEWAFPRSAWATEWRYSNDTDLRNPEVVMAASPHDCEFWSAPLGNKHCHYDKTVTVVRLRDGSGGHVVSYDDGRTWLPAEPDTRPSVVVSWTKVQD